MVTDEAFAHARIIWEYSQLGQEPHPADVILALGTNDLRVAEFAADLYLRGFGPRLICTGGLAHLGDLLSTGWDKTEAEMFADVAEARGVPRDRILLETRSTNTSENLRFVRELLDQSNLHPATVLIASKPFVQRRVFAALPIAWPEIQATIVSPEMTLDEYFTDELQPDKVINIMLGDLQRLWVYGKRGWSAPQEIPGTVLASYRRLKELGFSRQLIPEE
jgi:uncharacterized SAM-binding protein YcdF (DUF218 family)